MAKVLEPSITRGPDAEGSERSFGFVFAAVFTLYALWPLVHLSAPRWWALAPATAFAGVALIRPEVLRAFNRTWLTLGQLLHRLISPLVMGVIFFLCITPIAYIMRLRGIDVLSLKTRPDLTSYWIPRGPSRQTAETMKRQF